MVRQKTIPLLTYLYIFVPILLLVCYKVYLLVKIVHDKRPLVRCFGAVDLQ